MPNFEYKVTFPDGRIATTTTTRQVAHAVVIKTRDTWSIWSLFATGLMANGEAQQVATSHRVQDIKVVPVEKIEG